MDVAQTYNNLATNLQSQGRLAEAIDAARSAARMTAAVAGPAHPRRILYELNLGAMLTYQGRDLVRARAYLRSAQLGIGQRIALTREFDETARRDLAYYRPAYTNEVRAAWYLTEVVQENSTGR
ncbi:tetratricopeptide repeat protein [Sphingomonas sp. J315]|uniref:tetratricopeptide repeat protein n=1 Tax=Sphingomonas sp. J315 TaxID=2898433 RepID=UPI0028996910|nr:tetratricopeptide repeat protein [Sphingomonas sp. J315]